MPGWSKQKRTEFEGAFYDFLRCCTVNSRDHGPINLGENLYDAQVRFFTSVFDGLESDKHSFYCLKSRQLGMSTGVRALSVFYLGMHDGMTGALVMDTTQNRATGRREIVQMIQDLPRSIGFPRIKSDNRDELVLTNGTVIRFMAAGVKKTKSSGVLGRSLGLSMCHLSEICSYENDEGLVAFRESLSDIHPDRLYIYESTARGPNQWQDLWNDARSDPEHCVNVFLGWWSKNSQVIEKTDPDYEIYGFNAPSEKEKQKIAAVRQRYGHDITDEQLAWIRRKMDPSQSMGDVDVDDAQPDNLYRRQEQAWTEDDAFLLTGSVFFAPEDISECWSRHGRKDHQNYMFVCGGEFIDTKVFKAPNIRMAEFKVWEEPGQGHIYTVSCDVAFGSSERNDRSAIQVMDCYADGQTQVAEYAWPLITTRQFAWVIMAIAGWYAGEANEVYLIIEINGPGSSVWDEITYLRHHLTAGYQTAEVKERGLFLVHRNVRNYIYSRPDSLAAGKNYHWKCLALDTPLPTPIGWKAMGDVERGDILYDENGDQCLVTAAHPSQAGHPCFRLTFDDGTSIVADADHLWAVFEKPFTTKIEKLLPTSRLVARRHAIKATGPLRFPEAMLPIHPYVLGVWLGDGHAANGRYSAQRDDIEEIGGHLTACGAVLLPARQEK